MAERKRTVDARHDDPAWQCVEITEDTSNPRWRCLGCGECRSGSATRVVDHLLGRNRAAACNLSMANDAFKAALAKAKESEGKKKQKKERKKAVVAVNAAASKGAIVVQQRQSIAVAFSQNHAENCDAAIAELFFSCNIPAAVVDHPKFKAMVATLKAAPRKTKLSTVPGVRTLCGLFRGIRLILWIRAGQVQLRREHS